MADVLLVHGTGHGAWCWRDLIPELAALGHDVRAIDMPSHGSDPTPVGTVTLEACARSVLAALDRPRIVVGHSWGGYPITAAAELDPSRILRLVYLCAYAPRDGLSMAQMRMLAPRQPVLPAVIKSADGLSYTIDPEMAPGLFYNDCPPEAVALARMRLCPQAIAPQTTPLAVTARSAALPRSYIRCAGDQTIPPEFQTEMASDFAADDRHEMATGHSPFFADPGGLARLLDQIAKG